MFEMMVDIQETHCVMCKEDWKKAKKEPELALDEADENFNEDELKIDIWG